ncbi:MAG TPA: exodeoxyribonuclease VII large subunit, partial [Acidimicrobiales bacterium]|nr:exodeoxyribonuclease VII large subunit [Acidimicrobiales bacterium]
VQLFSDDDAPVRRISLVRLSGELARSVGAIGRVAVEGEVLRARTLPNGRIWFALRDRAVQITVAVPGAKARRARVVDGERVMVTGTVAYAAERGQLQLTAEEVVPVGAGAIAAMIGDVRRRLAADGLLDRPRRPLPRLPRVVGVVCGAEAAVKADIQSVVASRFPGYPLRFDEVRLSGPGAALAIAEGIARLAADAEVDVVIVARGGGDAGHMLPFSDEDLCRAICAAPVPVVTAIGHEGDRPVCDEVADLRCATPSLAAAAVVPSRQELWAALDVALAGAASAVAAHVDGDRRRLDSADPRAALDGRMRAALDGLARAGHLRAAGDPGRRVAEGRARLGLVDHRRPLASRVEHLRGELASRRSTVDAYDPRAVLRRGYAVVRGPAGRALRSPAEVEAGDILAVELADGSLEATVRDGAGGS